MVVTSKVILSIVTIFVTVSAPAQERLPVNPAGPLARRAGEVTQLESVYSDSLPADQLRLAGNATIISPCRIITNYHVAFGKAKKVGTERVVFVKDRAKGHEVNFAFDLDQSGHFRRNVKAKVIGFDTFVKSDAGVLGDMAVLELETCLDQKEYAQLDLAMADARSDVPVGALMTVSIGQDDNGKNQVLVQEGCSSAKLTTLIGTFVADCESVPGMSGSAVYEKGKDKKWYWTGLTAKGTVEKDGKTGIIAINAKTIAAFFNKAFGEVPVGIAVMASDDRNPQSTQSAMANTGGKVTVQ
jgi:hypothetical protein